MFSERRSVDIERVSDLPGICPLWMMKIPHLQCGFKDFGLPVGEHGFVNHNEIPVRIFRFGLNEALHGQSRKFRSQLFQNGLYLADVRDIERYQQVAVLRGYVRDWAPRSFDDGAGTTLVGVMRKAINVVRFIRMYMRDRRVGIIRHRQLFFRVNQLEFLHNAVLAPGGIGPRDGSSAAACLGCGGGDRALGRRADPEYHPYAFSHT